MKSTMALLLAVVLLAFVTNVQSEVFTAMADIEVMLTQEQHVTSVIDDYIAAEQKRLQQLKAVATAYDESNAKVLHLNAQSEMTNLIVNPINAFHLIKRLTTDWQQVEAIMRANSADAFLTNITAHRAMSKVQFPSREDLDGAAIALMRLQDVYRLDTNDVASGKIKGAENAKTLSAEDCYTMGVTASNDQDYYHTIQWMEEALTQLKGEKEPSVDRLLILDYLSFALYKQGNLKRALLATKELLAIDPTFDRAIGNEKWYSDTLLEEGGNPNNLAMPDLKNRRPEDSGMPERPAYEALCRGEAIVSPKSLAKLYCYYKKDRAYLKLAPAKIEVVLLNPMAVMLIDVISDEEINVIKALSHPKLQRATVQNPVTGELETATYRVSKSAWLKRGEHPVLEVINRRIDLWTNLNMDASEDLQLSNYGIGGHYDVHFDFARKEEKNAFKSLGMGNRIATVLFYLTNPEAGGATVFPLLNAAQFPVKNSALFWYNLMRDGEGDMRTRHAACPVLAGQKWVANYWIHERGQEFRRPCNMMGGEMANEMFVGDL